MSRTPVSTVRWKNEVMERGKELEEVVAGRLDWGGTRKIRDREAGRLVRAAIKKELGERITAQLVTARHRATRDLAGMLWEILGVGEGEGVSYGVKVMEMLVQKGQEGDIAAIKLLAQLLEGKGKGFKAPPIRLRAVTDDPVFTEDVVGVK